jgi:2-oxoglutarate decarboxylase
VLICSGKVVYDLEAEREKRVATSTAILRIEQWPRCRPRSCRRRWGYPNAELVWVQDEPQNQGAWPFMALNLPERWPSTARHRPLRVVARKASASPATGSHKKHEVEQAALIARAFDR